MSDNIPNSVKPGLKHVATAGEVLLIEDNTGEQIAIETRDSPVVIEFLIAFDNYLGARKEGVSGPVLDALWKNTVGAYHSLPVRIHKQLPSFAALGLVLP